MPSLFVCLQLQLTIGADGERCTKQTHSNRRYRTGSGTGRMAYFIVLNAAGVRSSRQACIHEAMQELHRPAPRESFKRGGKFKSAIENGHSSPHNRIITGKSNPPLFLLPLSFRLPVSYIIRMYRLWTPKCSCPRPASLTAFRIKPDFSVSEVSSGIRAEKYRFLFAIWSQLFFFFFKHFITCYMLYVHVHIQVLIDVAPMGSFIPCCNFVVFEAPLK